MKMKKKKKTVLIAIILLIFLVCGGLGALLTLAGFLGFCGSLIYIAVELFRKKFSKKQLGLPVLFLVMLCLGIVITPASPNTKDAANVPETTATVILEAESSSTTQESIQASKEESKQESIQASKEESKQESIQASKEESKQESVQASKEESKQESVQASKEESKQESIQASKDAAAEDENSETVWISATGSKYHNKPDCGNMNPNKARKMSRSNAEAQGYSACKKCY